MLTLDIILHSSSPPVQGANVRFDESNADASLNGIWHALTQGVNSFLLAAATADSACRLEALRSEGESLICRYGAVMCNDNLCHVAEAGAIAILAHFLQRALVAGGPVLISRIPASDMLLIYQVTHAVGAHCFPVTPSSTPAGVVTAHGVLATAVSLQAAALCDDSELTVQASRLSVALDVASDDLLAAVAATPEGDLCEPVCYGAVLGGRFQYLSLQLKHIETLPPGSQLRAALLRLRERVIAAAVFTLARRGYSSSVTVSDRQLSALLGAALKQPGHFDTMRGVPFTMNCNVARAMYAATERWVDHSPSASALRVVRAAGEGLLTEVPKAPTELPGTDTAMGALGENMFASQTAEVIAASFEDAASATAAGGAAASAMRYDGKYPSALLPVTAGAVGPGHTIIHACGLRHCGPEELQAAEYRELQSAVAGTRLEAIAKPGSSAKPRVVVFGFLDFGAEGAYAPPAVAASPVLPTSNASGDQIHAAVALHLWEMYPQLADVYAHLKRDGHAHLPAYLSGTPPQAALVRLWLESASLTAAARPSPHSHDDLRAAFAPIFGRTGASNSSAARGVALVTAEVQRSARHSARLTDSAPGSAVDPFILDGAPDIGLDQVGGGMSPPLRAGSLDGMDDERSSMSLAVGSSADEIGGILPAAPPPQMRGPPSVGSALTPEDLAFLDDHPTLSEREEAVLDTPPGIPGEAPAFEDVSEDGSPVRPSRRPVVLQQAPVPVAAPALAAGTAPTALAPARAAGRKRRRSNHH